MSTRPIPSPDRTRRVVIVGGGVAALEALMALHDHAAGLADVTLVAPERQFELKAMRTAEPFSAGRAQRHPLREIAAHFGALHVPSDVRRVDTDARTVVGGTGMVLPYDFLVLAPGARAHAPYRHSLTFGLDGDRHALNDLLDDLEQGFSRSIAFVVPPRLSWTLPLYELALMTARHARLMNVDATELTLVTPEHAPLGLFGPHASDAVAALLEQAGIAVQTCAYAQVQAAGRLTIMPGATELLAERIVTLPLLSGPELPGVPADEAGFIPVDEYGRVPGLPDVYAAGDATSFPVKQGGIACQQADAVASHIAAALGTPVKPEPFRPVLRGKLLTGDGSTYLRNPLHGGDGDGRVSDSKLWFPPAKVAGRYLGEWLAWYEGRPIPPEGAGQIDVEVALPPDLRTGDDPLALEPLGPLARHGWDV